VYRYCGKEWTAEDIERIRELIASHAQASRYRLSRLVSEAFEWRAPNGQLKDMSCRVAMLRMHRDGRIQLPAPKHGKVSDYQLTESSESDPQAELTGSVEELKDLILRPVQGGRELRRWNEFVGRYHYLGYKMLPGAQIRYLILDGGRVLGAMGFGAAAWKVAPRDQFIGWTPAERERGLHLIVGQSRFLILPWIHCRNLASKTLARAAARLPQDWRHLYGFQPALLETFVDTARFCGTCYKASNWIHVGHTQGRGKLDRYSEFNQPVKSIWLKPLRPDFRRQLKGAGA
jgi:hypothetical protein